MKIGSQVPRIKIEPPRVCSDGKGAAMLMTKYMNELDQWQKDILECWLGQDENGNYTCMSAGLSVPRQNGKNFCIEARELYGLIVSGERILHTAHQVRTSKRSFRRLVQVFTDDRYPELRSLVVNIRQTNGEEAISLSNGGCIEYCSRSKNAARGFDGISLVVFDEAQDLQDDQIESIMSVLSASMTGTRQIIYTGTPPYPNCQGTVFRRFRDSIIKTNGDQENKCNAWHEWSVAGTLDEVDISDRELWYDCNPALGTRITEEFVKNAELKTLSKDGFYRERLGGYIDLPTEKMQEPALDLEKWKQCSSMDELPKGKTAYGIKFVADGSEVCLCGAVLDQDGRARIELIERQTTGIGLQWLADWLNARYKVASCVVIDGRYGVDVLIEKISAVWVFKKAIIKPSSLDVVSAASMLMNEVIEQTVTWYGKQDDLDHSAQTSVKRNIGRGFGFGGEDSAPIEACALALWGVRTSKRNPQKKMRINGY
jgi:hypothetical protein